MRRHDTISEKLLSNTYSIGSFSPFDFSISLNCTPVPTLSKLSADEQSTLAHEFAHLWYVFHSYLGLRMVNRWISIIDELRTSYDSSVHRTKEEWIRHTSVNVINSHRHQQINNIDNFYYYEYNPAISWEANIITNRPRWLWEETTGGLFKVNGQPSTMRFWALNFCLVDGDNRERFCRIPIGIRTLTEHISKCGDIVRESYLRNADIQEFLDEAYNSYYLHYYALTHRVARFYKGDPRLLDRVFIDTFIITYLCSLIPYDIGEVWSALCLYEEKNASSN